VAKKTEYIPRLQKKYFDDVVPALMKKFKYENIMQVPALTKITINVGIGEGRENPAELKSAVEELRLISGQQPIINKAKKAISNFKIRQGDPVGCNVTIRRFHMYEFFDRLVSIALPRVRDFSGIPDKSFDGRGNYNVGIKEQIIFPEINYDKIDKIRGMDISIATTAATDEEAYELLSLLGLPFKKRKKE